MMNSEVNPPDLPKNAPEPQDAVPQQPCFASEMLFGDRREITILHNGERYRLLVTRNNKLILQK